MTIQCDTNRTLLHFLKTSNRCSPVWITFWCRECPVLYRHRMWDLIKCVCFRMRQYWIHWLEFPLLKISCSLAYQFVLHTLLSLTTGTASSHSFCLCPVRQHRSTVNEISMQDNYSMSNKAINRQWSDVVWLHEDKAYYVYWYLHLLFGFVDWLLMIATVP